MLTKYNLAREGKLRLPQPNQLTYQYLCGSLSEFIFPPQDVRLKSSSTFMQEAKEDFEESLTRALLQKRNQNMVAKIIKELRSGGSRQEKRMFFAIGAGIY